MRLRKLCCYLKKRNMQPQTKQEWDLLDTMERDQPDMAYNAIKDELFDEDDEEFNDGYRNWSPRDLT